MNTYNLKTVEEAFYINNSLSTTTYQIPVDDQGNTPAYLDKFRLVTGGQMLVFDTEQEYRNYIASNT
jgi:hypothetical protein